MRWLLLASLLAACSVTAPPRDNAQFTTALHGVTVTWRYVSPGALGPATPHLPKIGHATWGLGGGACVVDIDPALSRQQLTRVAAHEYFHCAAARYLLPGRPRPDLGTYWASPGEGAAQTYALAYLQACGDSLRPLGWQDLVPQACAEAPDPKEVAAH